MVFKKCSKFHRCSLRGFNLIETVCELFDNLSYVHLSTAYIYIYMRITFYHHVTWQYDSTSILHHNEPMNSVYIFKRLAYNANRWMSWVQINDATGCFVKAIPMGQNIVLDKSYTKQLGQISILEHCILQFQVNKEAKTISFWKINQHLFGSYINVHCTSSSIYNHAIS